MKLPPNLTRLAGIGALFLTTLMTSGCGTPPTAPTAAAPPPAAPMPKAVLAAANNLFGKADLSGPAAARGGAKRLPLVIDPLVDGNTGYQSQATRAMQGQVVELLQAQYPAYEVLPFTSDNLAQRPLLFIGTFTAVDKERKNIGDHDAYRICLALVDLQSGKILSKGLAFAEKDGVDITPTPFFQDSPAWTQDPATQGYVRTCQGTKPGDPINPAYWDRIMQAALINDATTAYEERNYQASLDLFKTVARQPGGDQLRVHNGLYLAAAKLGHRKQAAEAFGKVVDFGLANNQLGVKFTFRPGSTLFPAEAAISGDYSMWIAEIAQRASKRSGCLEISGHSSKTGAEPFNQRLSLMRAQYLEQRIDTAQPSLSKRTNSVGKGSSEPKIGLGTDDVRDQLDRRVEFKALDCPAT